MHVAPLQIVRHIETWEGGGRQAIAQLFRPGGKADQ